MAWGFIGSSFLHVITILLLIYWLLPVVPDHRPPKLIMPIAVVGAGTGHSPPPSGTVAPRQAKRSEPVAVARKLARAPDPPRIYAAPRRRRYEPSDSLAAQLQIFARRRESPRVGQNLSATDGTGGGLAGYGVKDFIRRQIERHWSPDPAVLRGAAWTVGIHLELDSNGAVELAEIVDTPRLHTDPGYREFCYSIRNAVLAASPIAFLPGDYPIVRDMRLDFDSQAGLR